MLAIIWCRIFQYAIQKYKDCFVLVWNLVAHIEGGMYAEGFPEMGAGDDIWTYEGRGKSGVEKTT